jgi:CubicO group peptidase (beta-lactamase class C family)
MGTTELVRASSNPLPLSFLKSPPKIEYQSGFSTKTVDDYLLESKATSLIILKDGQIVLERYQYDRKPEMRFRSFSMAKTFTAMLVGIAHQRGLIKSLDDKASDYWPEISASAYGQTTIRNLLYMSSGIPFKELYTWTPEDDNWVWGQVLYAERNRQRPEAILEYLNLKTQREVDQGSRFKYASIETEILGRVLRRASGKSVSQLTEEWLWKPMGAESDARWLLSTTDLSEATAGGFNATLRDYARFGILLANDGNREGNQIIPLNFLLDATDSIRLPPNFKPKVATPFYGYGYQTWVFPMKERTFALQGIHGQVVLVQPASKIVMVQTSVFDGASGRQDSVSWLRIRDLWTGALKSLGGKTD